MTGFLPTRYRVWGVRNLVRHPKWGTLTKLPQWVKDRARSGPLQKEDPQRSLAQVWSGAGSTSVGKRK